MIIRPAENVDLDEIVRLNNLEAEWVGSLDKTFFEKYLKIPFFEVIEENGSINAFMMAMSQSTDYGSKNFIWFRDRVKEFYYIDRVVVESAKRGKGLGKALYNKLIQGRNGLPIVAEVSINPPNTGSILFHEAFGFRDIETFSADGKKTCRMYQLD